MTNDIEELRVAAREFLDAETRYTLDRFVQGEVGPTNWPLFATYELAKARLHRLVKDTEEG